MSGLDHVEFWTEGNSSRRGTFANSLNQSQGLVVSSEGEIYVDNGAHHGRVERWTWNASTATNVMNISASCFSLFLGPNDTLYCSLATLHQVVSRSLRTTGTTQRLWLGMELLVLSRQCSPFQLESSLILDRICMLLIGEIIALNCFFRAKSMERLWQAMAFQRIWFSPIPSESCWMPMIISLFWKEGAVEYCE